jgi:hypothetical protein
VSLPRLLLSIVLSAVAANSLAAAPTSAQLDQARTKGLAWLVTHQSGDGSWKSPSGLAIQPTSAALDALANAGIKQGYVYAASQAWLGNADGSSIDSLSRKTIALFHSGANVAPLASQLLLQRNDLDKAWGAYPKYQSTFPDSALALDAILVSGATYADTGYTLGFVAGKQNVDGGWPYSASAPTAPPSSLIPSACSVLMLTHAKVKGWNVDANITNGVNWIVAHAKADGGFADDTLATTGSPLETALAYLALIQAKAAGNAAAVAAQATIDNASSFLVSNQGSDGNWSNDPFATAVALQTLPLLAPGTLADSNKNGVPDTVEALLGGNPAAANRSIALGNGQSVTGITASQLLASGTQYQAISLNLTASGGTAPYTWSVASGYLPDGLILNASTGQISGTPASIGTFNFSYTVQDAASASTTVAAQIAVAAPATANDTDVPTLPQWGVILMALLLMASMTVMSRKSRG